MTLGCWQFPFKGHSVFSAVAWWCCWCCFVIDDFLVVFFDDHGHILCAAVADFDGISIKYFLELARSREVLVN